MNIKFNNDGTTVKIENLTEGDTFIEADEMGYLEPTVYMIIDEPCQFFTRGNGYNYYKYALNLESGRVTGFEKNDKVVLVNCDLKVTIK